MLDKETSAVIRPWLRGVQSHSQWQQHFNDRLMYLLSASPPSGWMEEYVAALQIARAQRENL